MPALLALIDAVLAGLGDEPFCARIHARASDVRRDDGPTAGTLVRAESVVQAVSECLDLPITHTYELIGERAVPLLAREMAAQLRQHSTAHTFCLHLNTIVQSELQAMVPTLPLPFVDVEMLDFTALRLSFVGNANAVALTKGMLRGVARCYGQEARFSEVPPSQMSPTAVQAGRRYLDLSFVADSREEIDVKRSSVDDQRRPSPTVALKGLFR